MKSLFRFDPFLAARGTEEFWVPAVLSGLGTAVNYANTKSAQNRSNTALTQSLVNQNRLQQEGTGKVDALTRGIAASNPDQIASKEESDLVSTLRRNAVGSKQGSTDLTGLPTSSLTGTGGSNRYNSDVKSADAQTENYGTDLASQIAGIDAATRQRQNEGLAESTVGTQLNLLGAQSYTQDFVDRLRAEANGQTSPWLTLLGGGLQAAGGSLSKNAGGSKTPTSARVAAPASTFSGSATTSLEDPTGAIN